MLEPYQPMNDYERKVATTIRDLKPRWTEPDGKGLERSGLAGIFVRQVEAQEQFERDVEQWRTMVRKMRGAMFQLSAGETGYGTPTHAKNYARAFNAACGYLEPYGSLIND